MTLKVTSRWSLNIVPVHSRLTSNRTYLLSRPSREREEGRGFPSASVGHPGKLSEQ
jgi:hypothetical protein